MKRGDRELKGRGEKNRVIHPLQIALYKPVDDAKISSRKKDWKMIEVFG